MPHLESRRVSCKELCVTCSGRSLRIYDDDADWDRHEDEPAIASSPPGQDPPPGVAETSHAARIPPVEGGATFPHPERHPEFLDPGAASPVVLVALGDRQYLGDR